MRSVLVAFAALFSITSSAEVRNFTLTTVEVGGVKMWLPSTLAVKEGDTVKIKAIPKIKGTPDQQVHGFAIDAFGVETTVDAKGKDIEFVAKKEGIYPIRCHMHPAHVGGQLIVLD